MICDGPDSTTVVVNLLRDIYSSVLIINMISGNNYYETLGGVGEYG